MLQKDSSSLHRCFTYHTHKHNVCMFQVFVCFFFFLQTHQKKKIKNWHSLSDCPSDISAAVSSETQSWSPDKQVHPKENSCRAVIWQKEHHSTSAVLLSSLTYCQVPGTLPECWHTKYHSSHSTGVLHSLFTGPRCYPSTDITQHSVFHEGMFPFQRQAPSKSFVALWSFAITGAGTWHWSGWHKPFQEHVCYSWLGRNKASPQHRASPPKSFSHQTLT